MKQTKENIKKLQRALQAKGFYLNKRVDGIWGPNTERAVIGFKRSVGLRPRAYVGPITWGALTEGRHAPPKVVRNEPNWLRIARSYMGLREYRGSSHNKKILQWWKDIGLGGIKDDETAWCAAYVGGVLVEAGLPSTKSGLARSYDKWGKKLKRPAVGSIVTFWRESPRSWKGHVGFVVGKDQKGRIMCLGGNQGNATNIKAFSHARVANFVWPVNTPYNPNYNLPIVRSDGTVSRNEA